MQEPRLTEVTLLYARGKNLSTDEFGWRLKRRHLTEGEYAVIPSRPGAPESRAAGPQVCNQTVYLIYLNS